MEQKQNPHLEHRQHQELVQQQGYAQKEKALVENLNPREPSFTATPYEAEILHRSPSVLQSAADSEERQIYLLSRHEEPKSGRQGQQTKDRREDTGLGCFVTELRKETAPPGPRPAPIGQDSPAAHLPPSLKGEATLNIGSWSVEVKALPTRVEAPRRVGSGRVPSALEAREAREAGRGEAVEGARSMMERMRLEEREQMERWRKERGYENTEARQVPAVESGPRPRPAGKQSGSAHLPVREQRQRGATAPSEGLDLKKRGPGVAVPLAVSEQRQRGAGAAAPRPSAVLTLNSFLPGGAPIARPGKARLGGRKEKGPAPAPGQKDAAQRPDAVRPEAAPCLASCYWRSQDSTAPTQVTSAC